ncbi:hypothetical protein HanIR_Chr01g0003811 [Helianthus annuus]|nr:hypothetical protein HanIR_Chr01g0003811 [Helianthus annuus]
MICFYFLKKKITFKLINKLYAWTYYGNLKLNIKNIIRKEKQLIMLKHVWVHYTKYACQFAPKKFHLVNRLNIKCILTWANR